MYAEFDDSLVTGNELIDGQHKELIDKINALLVKCENKTDKAGAVRMLDYLAEYTEFHFKAEEGLQESIGYPGLKEHRAKHDELRRVVADLHEMLEDQEGPTDEFVAQVQKQVVDWLYYHIKTFDRSVAEYKFMNDNPNMI